MAKPESVARRASPRIIIPTSYGSYIARATDPNVDMKYKDPNERLTSDSEAFRIVVRDTQNYALIYALEADREAREKYIRETAASSKINSFLGQVKASADTPAIPTNFPEFDKILDDGLYEGLYILGAISSLGKTSFALQVADQIAQQGQGDYFEQ